MADLRNRAAFFRNPDYVKHGFPGDLIEPLAVELEAAADHIEELEAKCDAFKETIVAREETIAERNRENERLRAVRRETINFLKAYDDDREDDEDRARLEDALSAAGGSDGA